MERKCYKYPSIKIENLPPGYNRKHPSAWAGATNGLPDLQYICEWINGILVSIDAWAAGKPTLKTSVGCMDLWSACRLPTPRFNLQLQILIHLQKRTA
ncbi:uncharacterized protein LOC143031032 isoform X2 [Oratosquilla oratoria]|uniref:uncharacterized protein LOC143031032 isoform X2 n=1 Tax=Oratosquilla oratoria TaxID=337810 RepID=UPI003F764C55